MISDNQLSENRPAIRLISPAFDPDLSAQRLSNTNLVLQSTFLDVPETLKKFAHQPMHAAIDELFLTTKMSPDIFLNPDYSKPFYRFEKGFKNNLQLLQQMLYPDEFQADSLKNKWLGKFIVNRNPEVARVLKSVFLKDMADEPAPPRAPPNPTELLRLIIAQQQRQKARKDYAA